MKRLELKDTINELSEVFRDMFQNGVGNLTIGQYLAPSKNHYPIIKYYTPAEFESLADRAIKAGIDHVFSAPLVISFSVSSTVVSRSYPRVGPARLVPRLLLPPNIPLNKSSNPNMLKISSTFIREKSCIPAPRRPS